MSVTVYSQPACPQCRATHRAMERAGIPHTVVNLPDDAIALEYVRSLGYRQAPVVVAGAEHWSGFRPDRIASLSNAQLAA